MMKTIEQHHRHQMGTHQKGAALVVALVLVLVSTLMGVTAMQVSDVENQLVNNNKFRQVAFRAAEAASEQLFTIQNLVTLANETAPSVTSTTSVDTNVVIDAEIRPFGDGPATGYTLGGQNGFKTLKFVASATATMANVDSSSQVIQGVQRLSLSSEK